MNPRYKEIANYVVENDASKNEVCKEFSITKRMLRDDLRNLRNYDFITYIKVAKILRANPSKRGDLPRYLNVTQYIQVNKPNKERVCERFNFSNKNLYDSLRYLKVKNNNLYNRVSTMIH